MRVVVVALLAACSAPPKPAIGNTTPAKLGPAPLVERGGRYGLTTQYMPAIAADGSQIVAAIRESDGDRGFPNMTLVVKDRRDTEVMRHVVLSIDESDTVLDDAEGNNPQLDARVTRANTWLAKLGFESMRLLENEKTEIPFDRTKAFGDGVTVFWEPSHLRITDGTTVLVDTQTPASWLPESSKVGTNVCQRSAYLGSAAIARAHELAVVTISYIASSDFCLPPPDQHHVIVW